MASEPLRADQPIALRASAWGDYALIDSGDGRKLERYGPFTVVRPEPQCLWRPRLPPEAWSGADVKLGSTCYCQPGV